MGEARPEPSMEEILASIKRIIADDAATPAPQRPRVAPVRVVEDLKPAVPEADILELSQPVPAPEPAPVEAPAPAAPTLVSEQTAAASREALAALSRLVVAQPAGAENSLEGLVREMLRPMLREWLDARLPDMVEGLVSREIARITGKL